MSSMSHNIWASKSPHAPQLTTWQTLKAWCIACRPWSFMVYFIAISLGLFIAQKELGYVSYGIYFLALCTFFGVHAAVNMLCDLFDYIEEKDVLACRNVVKEGLLSPRSMTLSIMGLTLLTVMSGVWLVVQSGNMWPCLLIFLSIMTAMLYGASFRRTSCLRLGTSFLTCNIALGILAMSYAVISHDFTPYAMILTVPVSLLVACVMQYQALSVEDKYFIACKHILNTVFGKDKVSIFFRFYAFAIWALMLNIILSTTFTHEVNSISEDTIVEVKPIEKSILEQYSSANTQHYTQDAIDRGVTYGFGAKDSSTGAIDCSGWIEEINLKMMRSVNASIGHEVYGQKAKLTLSIGAHGGAAGLILAVKVATDEFLLNEDLSPDKVREGLTIGLDTGEKDWDIGRFAGIDHIVQTYKDQESGQMMVSQSSGKIGVHRMPYEDWYATWNETAKLYGVDMSLLADPVPAP